MSSEKKQQTRELIIAPSALLDMQELYDYIADDSSESADHMIEHLWAEIRRLGNFPGSGHSRIDLAGKRDLLFWPAGRYLILYRLSPSSVEIAAVLHASRDIPTILQEREPED